MILSSLLSRKLLVMLCLLTAFAGLHAEQNQDNAQHLNYDLLISQLPKDLRELEESVAYLRKNVSKDAAKKLEISRSLNRTVLKVSALESKKQNEQRPRKKEKIREKLSLENVKYEDLAVNLELLHRNLIDLQTTLRRKEVDLQFLHSLIARLTRFDRFKKRLYDKIIANLELNSYWLPEFDEITKKIAAITQAEAALAAVEADQELCKPSKLDFLASLTSRQVIAWELTKQMDQEVNIRIDDVSHIQNDFQLEILNFLGENKILKPGHLDDLKYINNKFFADAYTYLLEKSQEAPSSFWRKVAGIKPNWQRSPTFVFQSIQLIIDSLGTIHADLWELLPSWDNHNSLKGLEILLGVDGIRQQLQQWSDSEDRLASLDFKLQDLLTQSSQINSRERLLAFQYYCNLESGDSKLKLEKTILDLLGFNTKELANIDSATKLDGLKLLTQQYLNFMKQKRPDDFESFPWQQVIKKPFVFSRLNNLGAYQLHAIEAYVEKNNTIPKLTEFSYVDNPYKVEAFRQTLALEVEPKEDAYEGINSNLDVELFSLCSKHQNSPDEPFIYGVFREIPSELRASAKQIFAEFLEHANEEVNHHLLDLLPNIRSIHSLKVLQFLNKKGKQELIDKWILNVDSKNKYHVIKICLEKFGDLQFDELASVLPEITAYPELMLLQSMIAGGLDLKDSFAKVKHMSTLAEKIDALGLRHQYWELQLEELLRDAPELDGEELDSKIYIDAKFVEFLAAYKNSARVKQLLSSGYLSFCQTKDCTGLLASTGEQHNKYCVTCDEAICGHCQKSAHHGSCESFKENDCKVKSKNYPGAANFHSNLRNVCFFNSLMKLMTQMVATVPEFERFLDPNRESAAFVQAGEALFLAENDHNKLSDYNNLRKKLKRALYRWVNHALRGFDLYEDQMAGLTHQVLDPLAQLLEMDNYPINGALNSDQLDSQEVFSYLLSKLGFEFSELAMKLDQEAALPQVGYSNHVRNPESLLSVPISNHNDLSNAVDQMWDAEVLSPDEWLRHSDGEKYQTIKTLRLVNSPKLLVIHQKRFIGAGKKLTHAVKVSETLFIPRFNEQHVEQLEEVLKYQLVALTLHKGRRANSGHYTAYTVEPEPFTQDNERFPILGKKKVFPYTFISHDDAKVREVPSMAAALELADHEAYLLAYKLSDK